MLWHWSASACVSGYQGAEHAVDVAPGEDRYLAGRQFAGLVGRVTGNDLVILIL
jgi:hypothetical protein